MERSPLNNIWATAVGCLIQAALFYLVAKGKNVKVQSLLVSLFLLVFVDVTMTLSQLSTKDK